MFFIPHTRVFPHMERRSQSDDENNLNIFGNIRMQVEPSWRADYKQKLYHGSLQNYSQHFIVFTQKKPTWVNLKIAKIRFCVHIVVSYLIVPADVTAYGLDVHRAEILPPKSAHSHSSYFTNRQTKTHCQIQKPPWQR